MKKLIIIIAIILGILSLSLGCYALYDKDGFSNKIFNIQMQSINEAGGIATPLLDGSYAKGDENLNLTYQLITDKDTICGRAYTPLCFFREDTVEKNMKTEYLKQWQETITDYKTECTNKTECNKDKNKTEGGIDCYYPEICVDKAIGSHLENKCGWFPLGDSKTIDKEASKDSFDYFDISSGGCHLVWKQSYSGKEAPVTIQTNIDNIKTKLSFASDNLVDVVPSITITDTKSIPVTFEMKEMAWWDLTCSYKIPLQVKENNGSAMWNYPVCTDVNATSHLDFSYKTYVAMNDLTQTNHMFNSTAFVTGKNYTLCWNTNVSASGTQIDYLYYGCGNVYAEKNVSSYKNNVSWTKGYWKLDGTYDDSSSNGYTLTPAGNPLFKNGKWNSNGTNFDGSSNLRATIPMTTYDISKGMTIEMWVKPTTTLDATSSILAFASHIKGTEGNGWQLIHYGSAGSGQLGFGVGLGGAYIYAVSIQTLTAGTWYHIAGTYDGTNIKLYLNGVLVGITNNVNTIGTTSLTSFTVGARRYNDETATLPLNGIIDEVRYLNYSLPASEIVPKGTAPSIGAGAEQVNILPPIIQNISIAPNPSETSNPLNCSANYGGSNLGLVNITWYNGSTVYSSAQISNVADGAMVSNQTKAGIQATGEIWNCTINATSSDGSSAPNSTVTTGIYCQFQGRVKDSDGITDINLANVVIINQTDNKRAWNVTSNTTGGWATNISTSGYFSVYSYNPADITKDADADPFIWCS